MKGKYFIKNILNLKIRNNILIGNQLIFFFFHTISYIYIYIYIKIPLSKRSLINHMEVTNKNKKKNVNSLLSND